MKKYFITRGTIIILLSLLGMFYAAFFLIIFKDSHLIKEFGFILFCIFLISANIYVAYIAYLYRRQKKIIDKLIIDENYKEIVITGVKKDEESSTGKITRYVYTCIDEKTKNSYKSDSFQDIEESKIAIGDIVKVYQSEKHPKIYWVDLSSAKSSEAQKYLIEKEKGEKTIKKIIYDAKYFERNKFYNIFIICGFVTIFSMVGLVGNIHFYLTGKEVEGVVKEITTQNDTCTSGGKYSNQYNCTRYIVNIELQSEKIDIYKDINTVIEKENTSLGIKMPPIEGGLEYPVYSLLDKSHAGHNQPINLSEYSMGQKVNIITKIELSKKYISSSMGKIQIKDELYIDIKNKSMFMLIFLLIGLSCLYVHFRKNKTLGFVS